MTLRDDIQSALRDVNSALGETWQYRRRTSGPVTETRTYGSWADVTVNATSRSISTEWDDRRNAFKKVERMRARISDAVAELHDGDQLKDASSVVYTVSGILSQAPGTGTIAYEIKRDLTLKGEVAGGRDGGA